jgi:hypothetical protein
MWDRGRLGSQTPMSLLGRWRGARKGETSAAGARASGLQQTSWMAFARVGLWSGLVLLLGCPAADSDVGRDAGADAAGASGSDTGSANGGTLGIAPPMEGKSAPGPAVGDPAVRGAGACSNTTLADVIAAIHAQWPMLADITVGDIVPTGGPVTVGDTPKRIYAFATAEGLALAFRSGSGDCPSGCIDSEYWYFVTDAACAPALAGHFRRTFHSQGNCFAVEGTPMWGLPAGPPDPGVVCGADNRPQNITGSYVLHGKGSRIACTAARSAEPMVAVETSLTLVITQDPANLATGTVSVMGTGDPRLDGHALPALFKRRRVDADKEFSNLPAQCIDQQSVHVEFDVEAGKVGHLRFNDVRDLDCPPAGNYCKGYLDLALSPAP